MGKNIIIFGVDMGLSVDLVNKNIDIIVLGEAPTQELDNSALQAEAEYPINFTQSRKRFGLTVHDNGSNGFLFVNGTKTYQFKAKDSKIKDYTLRSGNISKIFTVNDMKKSGLKAGLTFFSVDFNPIDTNAILDVHKYLINIIYETMFRLIKKIFVVLLTSIVSAFNHTRCVSLSSHKCMTQPTLINLHPNKYSQELHYYPFVVNVDKYIERLNTLNNLSNKVCVPNKTEDCSNEHVQHDYRNK